MGKLADLAARCLELKGGRIVIDLEIYMVTAGAHSQSYTASMPAYTASIDAAITLIPKGWRWSLEYVDGYSASVNSGNSFPTLAIAGHPTSPALALCAAALRARDLVEGEGA